MSMVARTNPGPAEDDITDTDDGDTRISAGAFWPDIVLRERVWRYDCRAA